MPHDKKGRLIEVGDHVRFGFAERYDYARGAFDYRDTIGRVHSVSPASETCNLTVAHLVPGYWPIQTATLTAKETEIVLKAAGSEPDVDVPAATQPDPAQMGRGRIGALVVAALLALAGLVAPAFAQTPAPPATTAGWTASLYGGAASVITRGERREYVTARATLAGPITSALDAFVRADVTGTEDGGSVELQDPGTFRTLEVNAGLSHRVGLFDLAAVGGVTYSIEGTVGAPIDPRMFTGLALAKARLRDGGYVGGGGGWYGPVGGGALVLTTSVPMGGGTYATTDFGLPVRSNALAEKSWLLTVGATKRFASFDLGKVLGR